MRRIAKGAVARKVWNITIKQTVDESPDLSTLGQFTDTADEWAIVREGEHAGEYVANLPDEAELPQRGREYRFFKPYAGGEKEGTDDYQKYGLQDWERAEGLGRGDWCYVGISARLEYTNGPAGIVQTLRSGGLWGVESDSGADYLASVAKEELDNLRREAEAIGIKWPTKMAKHALEALS